MQDRKLQDMKMTDKNDDRARSCRRTNRVLTGALKMLDVKMTDVKLTDQMTGHENAGHEIAGHKRAAYETDSEAANV